MNHCGKPTCSTVIGARLKIKNSTDMPVDCVWKLMAHAQKSDFVFRRNGRVHLNLRGRHFSRLLAAEVCASAVVMPDTACSEVVWRVLAAYSIRQFHLHFPSRASPCANTFQLDSNFLLHQPTPTEDPTCALTASMGELIYLAPLGSENISAPYFKQCFFQGGEVLPPRLSQTPRLPVLRQK